MQTPPTSAALLLLPTPAPGDPEQEVMLTTKTPKATVGGLSPSKGYTLQIFELTGSGNVLLARREFVSKCPGGACVQKRLGARGVWMGLCGKGCVGSPQASIPPPGGGVLISRRISL